jgi:anhydro-N-acetylmuramic acid kinase
MIYRAIGLMSGSSLDGLDIAYVEFHELGGKWSFEILEADCYPYPVEWTEKLKNAIHLSAREYQLLHTAYGHYTGLQVNKFIEAHQLQYKVAVIASHGHTTFHLPEKQMTAQLGDGAAIAAETGLPVVSDLRALDVAFGGQGAPIVPIGEKMLMGEFSFFLNIGGIANISFNADPYIAFDICPANRVLNMLANEAGLAFDEDGKMAAAGSVDQALLAELNGFDYYIKPFPKSLANDFGTDTLFPLITGKGISIPDALRTYVEHIVFQITRHLSMLKKNIVLPDNSQMLCTGGGAFNHFLTERLKEELLKADVELVIPDKKLVSNKEALIMAFIGVLRWRQENTVLSSVTGASRHSIGGALWIGQEA